MNTGVIASRYALALFRFATAQGDASMVCRQSGTILKAISSLPELRHIIENPVAVEAGVKLSLLETAAGETLAPSLRSFLTLVNKKGRVAALRLILYDFRRLYFKAHNIIFGKLVTVVPSPELEQSIKRLVKERTGCALSLETTVDESLIGGFVFTLEDKRIDASVSRQLRTLHRQFSQKNKRIV